MERLNQLTDRVICSAIQVHRELGPGLLESTYEACLEYEFIQAGLVVERQKGLPVKYRGVEIECGYRLDLVVENKLIVELKSVEKILPIHRAQLLSYLKISGMKLGLLLNFNVKLLKDGLVRISN
jgi:GxxExxY protein